MEKGGIEGECYGQYSLSVKKMLKRMFEQSTMIVIISSPLVIISPLFSLSYSFSLIFFFFFFFL